MSRMQDRMPSEPPDALFINGRFLVQPFSGVQRFATEITAAMQRSQGRRVTVLGPQGMQPGQPLAARSVGRRQGHAWEQIELPRHARRGVLINLGNTGPLRRIPQIVVIHDAGVFSTPEAYSWKFRAWYKLAQQRLVRSGARIVTVSEFARGEISRHLGLPPDDVVVVSEGADHMQAIKADRSILARVPEGRFVLVVGNLAAHKNLSALNLLAARLSSRGTAMVITGSLAAGAFQQESRQSLPQPACYLGRTSDGELKALYETASCLVFPSRYEGFGLPAIEAMSVGCPVAVSRIPALVEVCADAATYFDPASPEDIADQVLRLLDDSVLEQTMRSAALRRALPFTWARAADQMARIAETCRPVGNDGGHR